MKLAKNITSSLTVLVLLSTVAVSALAAPNYHFRFHNKGLKRATSGPVIPGTPGGQPSPGSGTTPPVVTPQPEPVPQIVDVTGSFKIARSGYSINRITKIYTGTATLTNTSGQAMTGPFHFALVNLTAGTLQDASGAYLGAPYHTYNGALAAGEEIKITITLYNPDLVAVGYTPTVYRGPM